MIKEYYPEELLPRQPVEENIVMDTLLTVAKAKKAEYDKLPKGEKIPAILQKIEAWKNRPDLLTFTYEDQLGNANTRVATLSVKGREVGKVIIRHQPLHKDHDIQNYIHPDDKRQHRFIKQLKKAFGLDWKEKKEPLKLFRETYQFINNEQETLFLEFSDGAIPIDTIDPYFQVDSYGNKLDRVTTTVPFVQNLLDLVIRIHESGHGYQKTDGEMYRQLLKQGEDIYTLAKELQASAVAIQNINDILLFLGVTQEELSTGLLTDVCAEALVIYMLNHGLS